MKFVKTPQFDHDFSALPAQHQQKFRAKILPMFHDCAVRAVAGDANPWAPGLRVKKMQGTIDIWEMTWSWNNPDGRATWQWCSIQGEPGILWRRVGKHDIFQSP